MASPASLEASDIRRRGRQRLIGAIAIAVLLVVFVPMILDSEPRSARTSPALEIPPRQNAPALPPPMPDPAVSRPAAPSVAPAKPPPAEPSKAPAADPAKAPVPEVMKAPPAEPPRKADVTPKAAPKLEGFAVQVGAFKDEEKLKQARDKLAAARITHYIERIDAQAGALTRLRAGPYPTREAAEKALAEVKASSLDGKVVPLP